ncbi:MAG TPA: SUMF1/EgtB/PvdO family nonheme iron enzyme [Minicystis sp.]|nr:SUMF1/EgtB/PvdO family nonheme iron enzyme [Minicystis sp.]
MRCGRLATWALCAAALQVIACSAILGIDRDYHVAAGGASSASSTGAGGGASTGGASASSGTGGVGGAGGGSGGGGGLMCPSSVDAPVMVALDAFCIDATEVTNLEFWSWFTDEGAAAYASPPAKCAWKTAPDSANAVFDARPVVDVDWCDATIYCASIGRHLCGSIAGGALSGDDAAVYGEHAAWFSACSEAGARAYPYGDTYAPTACNGADFMANPALRTVQTLPGCRGSAGPYAQIFDMSGNAYEWIDACVDAGTGDARDDACRRLGGSAFSDSDGLRCRPTGVPVGDAGPPVTSERRDFKNGTTGFRCCFP